MKPIGKDVSLEEAVGKAAKLIGKAKLPMFGGLATDVEGMRAVLALADRIAVMSRGRIVGTVPNGPGARERIGELMVGGMR